MTLQKIKNQPMHAERTGEEKQLSLFLLWAFNICCLQVRSPSNIYISIWCTLCCLEWQAVSQKHCTTLPLSMVIQLFSDALQPELPDVQKAHNTDSVCTEQLCTAHRINQMRSGCLSHQASMDQLCSRDTVCPDCVPTCQTAATTLFRSPDMYELLVQQLPPMIFQVAV